MYFRDLRRSFKFSPNFGSLALETTCHGRLELSLVGHLTYRYIDGTYTDILICMDIILNFSKGV